MSFVLLTPCDNQPRSLPTRSAITNLSFYATAAAPSSSGSGSGDSKEAKAAVSKLQTVQQDVLSRKSPCRLRCVSVFIP